MEATIKEPKEERLSSHVHGAEINGVRYKKSKIEGLDIFYREAGLPGKPAILLLHGFPSSSHMFRNLLIALGDKYHLIAPDYPGFGNSSMPAFKDFEYSFDHLAKIIDEFTQSVHLNKFSLYMMDYGAPVGFRIATKHPERIQSLIIQNGNAYEEGLSPFWDHMKEYWKEPKKDSNINFIKGLLTPEGIKSQYIDGVRDASAISPDTWETDLIGLNRPGNTEIQLELFLSYRTNVELYKDWQKYLKDRQPETLIVWGKNDHIFPSSGAQAYKKDLKKIDFHLLNTGHFALEEDGTLIASLIDQFMTRNKIK